MLPLRKKTETKLNLQVIEAVQANNSPIQVKPQLCGKHTPKQKNNFRRDCSFNYNQYEQA